MHQCTAQVDLSYNEAYSQQDDTEFLRICSHHVTVSTKALSSRGPMSVGSVLLSTTELALRLFLLENQTDATSVFLRSTLRLCGMPLFLQARSVQLVSSHIAPQLTLHVASQSSSSTLPNATSSDSVLPIVTSSTASRQSARDLAVEDRDPVPKNACFTDHSLLSSKADEQTDNFERNLGFPPISGELNAQELERLSANLLEALNSSLPTRFHRALLHILRELGWQGGTADRNTAHESNDSHQKSVELSALQDVSVYPSVSFELLGRKEALRVHRDAIGSVIFWFYFQVFVRVYI